MEQQLSKLAKATTVVVEDSFGITKRLQNGVGLKHLLLNTRRVTAPLGS